ncbi:MAG: DUF1772 domain-containing protein [Deltaproteobacteria bacterium]
MNEVLQFIATLTCGIFTGAALYITLVEHPARMNCGTYGAVCQFGFSYNRAKVMQASLAVIGFVASAFAWWLGAGYGWLIGGIMLVSVVPFTFIAILPTNRKLLDPGLDRDSQPAHELMVKWDRLHAVRGLASLVAFVIFLWL